MLAQAPAENVEPAAVPEPAPTQEAAPADGENLGDDVPFSELNEALKAARSRLTELTKAAEIAKVAGELREQLEATEAENRELKSVLSKLQTDHDTLQTAKRAADEQLSGLEKASEEASAEITRLQRELDTAQELSLTAQRQQAETAAKLAELTKTSELSESDSARLAKDLDGTITELAKAQEELAKSEGALEETRAALEASEQETDVLREQLASNRSEAGQLRARLETTETDLGKVRTLNAGLEQQVELLKSAAGEATDAARQNLLAVEDQINEINAALASVKADELLLGAGGPAPDAGGPVAETGGPAAETVVALAAESGIALPGAQGTEAEPVRREATAADGWVPRPPPPRAAVQQQVIAAAVSDDDPAPSDRQAPLGTTAASTTPADEANKQASDINLASLTTDLPAGSRRGAQALLAGLKPEKDARGLSMTVPGAKLFAVDSEEIDPSAFEALSSVAKLVDLYDGRDVLIIGHTDAVGDAGYNQQLSERRAALVKDFFVERFEISKDRLRIEGQGEKNPISSNATADGRDANRRVEVVILN